jgi:hypothetical protein
MKSFKLSKLDKFILKRIFKKAVLHDSSLLETFKILRQSCIEELPELNKSTIDNYLICSLTNSDGIDRSRYAIDLLKAILKSPKPYKYIIEESST